MYEVFYRKRNKQSKESPPVMLTPSAPPEENTHTVGWTSNHQASREGLANPGYDKDDGKNKRNQANQHNGAVGTVNSRNGDLHGNRESMEGDEITYTTINTSIKNDNYETVVNENDDSYNRDDAHNHGQGNNNKPTKAGQQAGTTGDAYMTLGVRENPGNTEKNFYQALDPSTKVAEREYGGEDDSVMMVENDELYTSSVDLTDDDKDKNSENEYLELDDGPNQGITRNNGTIPAPEKLGKEPKSRQSFA